MAALSGVSFALLFFSHFVPWLSETITDGSGARTEQHFFLQGWGIRVAPCYNYGSCSGVFSWLSYLSDNATRYTPTFLDMLGGLRSAFGLSAVAFWVSLAGAVCCAHAYNRVGGGCCRCCCACCRCCCSCGPDNLSGAALRARASCEAYGAAACLAAAFVLSAAAVAAAGNGAAPFILSYRSVGFPISIWQAGLGVAACATALAALAFAAAVCFILALPGDAGTASVADLMLGSGAGDYKLVIGEVRSEGGL